MELTHDQAEGLGRRLQPMIGYVVRFRERLQRRGFTIDHPLYVKLRTAELGLLDVSIALHYASRRVAPASHPIKRSEKRRGAADHAGPFRFQTEGCRLCSGRPTDRPPGE